MTKSVLRRTTRALANFLFYLLILTLSPLQCSTFAAGDGDNTTRGKNEYETLDGIHINGSPVQAGFSAEAGGRVYRFTTPDSDTLIEVAVKSFSETEQARIQAALSEFAEMKADAKADELRQARAERARQAEMAQQQRSRDAQIEADILRTKPHPVRFNKRAVEYFTGPITDGRIMYSDVEAFNKKVAARTKSDMMTTGNSPLEQASLNVDIGNVNKFINAYTAGNGIEYVQKLTRSTAETRRGFQDIVNGPYGDKLIINFSGRGKDLKVEFVCLSLAYLDCL